MATRDTGLKAETAAADYLKAKGYEIKQRNWRTRWCEIDIVAEKDGAVYFVEVKYRKTTTWGGGLDYILPAKLRQMRFAAEMWVSQHDWQHDYSLAAIEVAGSEFEVTQFIKSI